MSQGKGGLYPRQARVHTLGKSDVPNSISIYRGPSLVLRDQGLSKCGPHASSLSTRELVRNTNS